MSSVSCFFKNPLSWMSIVGLVVAAFLGYGFSSILLTSILASSTLIFKFSKQKPILQVDKSAEDEISTLLSDQQPSSCIEYNNNNNNNNNNNITSNPQALDNKDGGEEEEDRSHVEEYSSDRSSPVILSESDCLGRSTTSEDSEVNYWRFQDNTDCSDGSISDEDSLIEIELPGGHYIGHHKDREKEEEEEEDHKFSITPPKKLQDFAQGSFFKQQYGLMELLAELNDMNIEEENFIEIDISMGSIKCPRFEIEA